jgi:hypothetical protein
MQRFFSPPGTSRIIDGAFKILANSKEWGIEEQLLDVTNFLKTTFDALENSLTHRQKRDLASKKFSFLNADQMDKFYGPGWRTEM